MWRKAIFAISVASALMLAGCGSDSGTEPLIGPSPTPTPTPTPTSRVRVVHASPNAPNVDVFVDGSRVLSNVPYRQFSGYLSVPAGPHNVRVTPANQTTAVINADVTLAANTDYTVLAVGRVANIEPLVLTDNNDAPSAGQVKVRLVHASPAAGNVDIYVTAPSADLAATSPTLSNIPFKAASDYLNVPAGSYRVRITPTGSKTVAIDTGTLNLAAGTIRTGVAVGDPGVDAAAGGPAFLDAVLLPDN